MAKRRQSLSDTRKSYQSRIDHARSWVETEGYHDLWNRMIDLYRGKHVTGLSADDQMVVNIAKSTVDVIAPSVSVNYPKITVGATKPEDEDRAVISEALVNWQWKHYSYQPEIRAAVKDSLMVGHGWTKTFWKYSERERPMNPAEQQDEFAQRVGEATEFAGENPELAADLPTDDEIAENLGTSITEVLEDQPVVERVSPFDVFVDPFAMSPRDMKWIAQRIYRPIEEARRDNTYKRGARQKLKGGDMIGSSERERHHWQKRDKVSPDVQYVTIWEFYDLVHQTMAVFAEESNEFLVDPMPIPFAGGHPFYMIRNYDVPEHFYPMGDLEALENLQLELNALRSQAHASRKKAARKYLFHESVFGSQGRQALESEQDNRFIPVADESKPLSEVVYPLPQTQFPAEMFNFSQQVEQDIATVSGVSEYQRGQMPETRRTATEAAIISDSSSARAADKLAIVELAIAEIGRKVLQLDQQFTTGEQVFQVVGEGGASVWVTWTRDDIKGEFDFDVEGGSTQPQNETVRRQTAIALSQAMQPFVAIGVVDPAALAQHMLREGFGVKNAHKFITPPAPTGPDGMPAEPGGVGGMQPPPMGGGYIDQGTGDTSSESRREDEAGGLPAAAQLAGQVGYGP